jgi:hypothetical protein
MTATRQAMTHIRESWWFKSMYILQEKSDTHDTYALMTSRMWQPFMLTQQSWTDALLHRKRAPILIHITSTDWSTGPHHFLSPNNHWSRTLKPSICWGTRCIGLLDSYQQHAISMFNTFSWGPTHQYLTDTDGGSHIGGVVFPHHSPRPSQLTILHFPRRVPFGLKLTSST